VADSAALDLTTGMTVEAWVYPTKRGGYRTVALKETARGLAYGLYAGSGHATTAREHYANATALPLNRWSHLAVTYDGTAVRTFVDGREVHALAQTGRLRTSTHPLRFGGNAVWREWFAGRLDEVRVYDRALTAAQLTRDMTTPIAGPTKRTAGTSRRSAKVNRYRNRGAHGG